MIHFETYVIDTIIKNLKRGKAAGPDNLSCEHLQYSHPIVCCTITLLYNLMLKINYVPNAFGEGIIVPIPKGDKRMKKTKLADYRGITLNCILSKIFEKAMLYYIGNYFRTSDRQFGFKKKVGCNNAIYSVRKTIDRFVTDNSTVNLCALDLSKAFDSIKFDKLFLKLIDKKFPKWSIEILSNWFSKL